MLPDTAVYAMPRPNLHTLIAKNVASESVNEYRSSTGNFLEASKIAIAELNAV